MFLADMDDVACMSCVDLGMLGVGDQFSVMAIKI
jgi:aminoglycoside phosphotransferase